MDYIIIKVKQILPFQFSFLYKYVDDIICGLPQDKIDYTLKTFNSIHNKLQFTVELEENQGVPFLDTKIIRNKENKLIIDWYTKPTNSGRYINYNSNHILIQKINTLKGMKNRIMKISHHTLIHKNLLKLSTMFIDNGFPKTLVKKILFNSNTFSNINNNSLNNIISSTSNFSNTIPINTPNSHDNNNLFKYTRIPYIPNLTHKLIKVLQHEQIKFAFYNMSPLKKIFTKLKDKTNKFMKSNVIYCVPCNNCSNIYIGLTTNWLKTRISTHKSDIRTMKNRCALSIHAINNNHSFDFDNTSILNSSNKLSTLKLMEMVEINKQINNTVNFKSDIENLHVIYANLLSIYNNIHS
ncbi:hypothetical protein RI129_006407 [Pyrocoelia pectoralis]|uniref:Helix-turn-helix domain-containing protein n=1 Tax=Pyrocoelia pectoralis TaxID=417401 RepID=A0AAN7ZIE4_9COLE